MQELLRRVVFQVCREPAWVDDLMQEAKIHLWLVETKRPAQTMSWYIQSCRFHLLNRLACGRSVDSHKRRQRVVSTSENGPISAALEKWERENAIDPEASEQEILRLLAHWLTPSENRVLVCLAEGLGVQETASRLGISHQAVSKHRRNIAAQAATLGLNWMT